MPDDEYEEYQEAKQLQSRVDGLFKSNKKSKFIANQSLRERNNRSVSLMSSSLKNSTKEIKVLDNNDNAPVVISQPLSPLNASTERETVFDIQQYVVINKRPIVVG